MTHINRLNNIIFFLLLLSLLVIALRAECEVLNLDTMKCELMSEQNLTLNSAWVEFY